MNHFNKFINEKKFNIFYISIFFIFSNCSFIDKNNYSFYETFINPEVSDLSEEFDNGSEKPDLDSVPESVVIDE